MGTRPEGSEPDLASGVGAIPGGSPRDHVAVEVRREGARAVVVVQGAIDLATCDTVWAGIEEARRLGGPLVIDLAGTSFVDSSGMALLVRAQAGLPAGADPIVVRGPGRAVRAVMEISGIDTVVTIESPR